MSIDTEVRRWVRPERPHSKGTASVSDVPGRDVDPIARDFALAVIQTAVYAHPAVTGLRFVLTLREPLNGTALGPLDQAGL